jgi:cytochrome c5
MLAKIGKVFLTLLMAFCLVAPGTVMAKKGNARKGKYLYRKHCRTCHKDGEVGKALSPVIKNHEDLKCADEWSKRKPKDLKDMHAHLWGHAYDSPSPAKCE